MTEAICSIVLSFKVATTELDRKNLSGEKSFPIHFKKNRREKFKGEFINVFTTFC